jgi:hypothetical protein
MLILVCVAAIGAPALTFAQTDSPQASQTPTRLVRFAGLLTDGAGTPFAGVQTVTFTLFSEPEGGTPLWSDTITVTADDRGRFAVYLGSGTALPLELFSTEQARWVGVSVGGIDLPRAVLVAVPYALKAADAESLGGRPAASFLTTTADGRLARADGTAVDGTAVEGSGVPGQIAKWTSGTTLGNSVISESASNRVGFGLTDPTGGGVVDSVFSIKNFDNNTGFSILNETQQRRFAINTLTTGGWLLYDGGGGIWNAGLGQTGGRIFLGAGLSSNFPKLHVQGNPETTGGDGIWADTSTSAGWGVRAAVNGGITDGTALVAFGNESRGLAVTSNHTTIAYFAGVGGVGIGTTVPADKLDVVGNIRVGTGTTGCVRDADATVIAGTCSSDARFKKNIIPFGATLGRISRLQPVYFDWRADEFADQHFGSARSFGLIAQDVEAVLPELVVTDTKGFRAVKYNELPFHMLQAIKELKAENDSLKQLLQSQEDRLRKLEEAAGK